jgi:hypothetical protein
MEIMKKIWLTFTQAVTVLLAAWFIVGTLQPSWLQRGKSSGSVSFTQAMISGHSESSPAGSFRAAAQKATPAVVSINVQQKARSKTRRNDPWFRFFDEPEEDSPSGGMGSGANAADPRFAAANIPEPLLFNLATDPNEKNNIISQHPEKAAELAEQLKSIVAKSAATQ